MREVNGRHHAALYLAANKEHRMSRDPTPVAPLAEVRSDRATLIALCNDHGFAVVIAAIRGGGWGARVLAGDRYVWVEDREDLEWLSVDLRTAPIPDRYIGSGRAA